MVMDMWWRILQGSIVLAAIWANIRWEYTPNGYVAAFLGVAAAFFVTGFLVKFLDWRRARQKPRGASFRP